MQANRKIIQRSAMLIHYTNLALKYRMPGPNPSFSINGEFGKNPMLAELRASVYTRICTQGSGKRKKSIAYAR
jgi:hypothetical protein